MMGTTNLPLQRRMMPVVFLWRLQSKLSQYFGVPPHHLYFPLCKPSS